MFKEKNILINPELLQKGFVTSGRIVNTYITIANEAARLSLDTAITAIKDAGKYRFNTKRWGNLAQKAFDKYEKILLSVYEERSQIMLDYLDAVDDFLRHDLDILTLSFKSVFDKARVEDSMLKAKIETSLTMLENATTTFHDVMDVQNHRYSGGVLDYAKYYRPYSMEEVYKMWCMGSSPLMKVPDGTKVDLNGDKNSRLAFDIIQNKLTDTNWLNKLGLQAVDLNIDLASKFMTKEEIEEIRSLKS